MHPKRTRELNIDIACSSSIVIFEPQSIPPPPPEPCHHTWAPLFSYRGERFFFMCTWVKNGYSTNRNSSLFAKNAEGVDPPQSIYLICNLCRDFSKKCGAFFGKKNFAFRKCGRFFHPSANAEDFEEKKAKKN